MMLRSKKIVTDISGVPVKRKKGRSRRILRRSLPEVHIEGRKRKSKGRHSRPFLHCGTGLCQALLNCDCISHFGQSSSVAELDSLMQAINSPYTKVGECSSAVPPSSTSSPQVLPNSNQTANLLQSSVSEDCAEVPSSTSSPQVLTVSNQTANLQPSSVSEDCAVVRSSTSSPQVLTNSNQTSDLQPSPASKDPVQSFEMDDSVVEVIPTEILDVSVLEIKSHDPPSNDKRATDADTSDIIIIQDSQGKGSVGNKALKTTSHEVTQLQGSRKRKISDESGVEILCDIVGMRPKKQQRMASATKEKKLWSNSAIKENFTVTVSDTDKKISELTKNEKIKDIANITSKQSSEDGDDIIFISAEDDEVSVIDTKEEQKPPQEDVIILDSPPIQISDKKPKKLVSTSKSVTGLIPHYTQHLIDYISLDGKPPATVPCSSTSTPLLNTGNRDRTMMHNHIPVFKRSWDQESPRRRQKQRAALRNRSLNDRNRSRNPAVHSESVPALNDRNRSRNPAVQSESVPASVYPSRPHALAENQISTVRNSTQNVTTQSVAPENSVQSAPEVAQSPACAYGTNIYNPNASDKEEDGLRPVIIDGNNIAMGHGKGKCFSWRGLHICIKYFLKRGHKVTAFVPTFRKGVCPPELRSEMEEYERSGQVVFTPSRRIEGRLIVPYDDRFIVQCAAELGGVIVSTDNFRDLLSENNNWKETIEKRLLMFTWVGDLLMFPHDPLGRDGPKLEEFLRFPKKQ